METDDAFLSDLLALLEDADDAADPLAEDDLPQYDTISISATTPISTSTITPTSNSTAWPPRLAETARQGVLRSGPKETMHALRTEIESLTSELERRRGGRPLSVYAAQQRALAERRMRERAERECQMLREAVYQQTQFMRGLDALVYLRPRFSLQLNLCRYLHRHVRLPRDRSSRWGDFDPVAHDARLQSAMDVLCRETAALTLSTTASSDKPFFHCAPVDDVDCHAITSSGVYTIDGDDVSAVVRGACVAVRDIITLCPLGHALFVARDIVDDAAVARNFLYRVLGVRHRNLHSGADVFLASHVVTSYKIVAQDNYAVVLWDFVDDDQLHPTPDATNITREITGACLIRRETCDDGVVRTVLRSLSTKRYRFHGHAVPERYGCVTEESMYANEQLFRNIVNEQVVAEQMILAQAQQKRLYPVTESDGACPCMLG